jgi:hypothetical protein
MGKWFWRFGLEESHLQKRVLAAKYGVDWGGWCTKRLRDTHGCGLWKSISRGWDKFSKHVALVRFFVIGKK